MLHERTFQDELICVVAFVFAVGLLFAFVLNLGAQFFTAVTASVLFATQTL